MVVVIVIVGLSGGEACRRGSTGDSSDLFLPRGALDTAVSPESGLSPLLQGRFSWFELLLVPLPLPVPLFPLSTLSTRRLCQELFP
jgi:hypothetical protein